MVEEAYSRIIYYNEEKDIQVKLVINQFKDNVYLAIREYYRDFDGEWAPSNKGVSIPFEISSSRELFAGLVEILSLAESRQEIIENFEDLMKVTHQ